MLPSQWDQKSKVQVFTLFSSLFDSKTQNGTNVHYLFENLSLAHTHNSCLSSTSRIHPVVQRSSIMSSDEDKYEPPKRNRTAYNMFYQVARKRILDSIPDPPRPKISKGRKKHGKISFQDLAKKIGQEWKALPDRDKAVYFEIARTDKERYLRDKKKWHESVAELDRQHSSEPLDLSMVQLPKKAPREKKKNKELVKDKTTPGAKVHLLPRLARIARVETVSPHHTVQPLRLPQINHAKLLEAVYPLSLHDMDMEPLPISDNALKSPPIPSLGFQQPFTAVEEWSFKRMFTKLDKSSVDFLVSRFG